MREKNNVLKRKSGFRYYDFCGNFDFESLWQWSFQWKSDFESLWQWSFQWKSDFESLWQWSFQWKWKLHLILSYPIFKLSMSDLNLSAYTFVLHSQSLYWLCSMTFMLMWTCMHWCLEKACSMMLWQLCFQSLWKLMANFPQMNSALRRFFSR